MDIVSILSVIVPLDFRNFVTSFMQISVRGVMELPHLSCKFVH